MPRILTAIEVAFDNTQLAWDDLQQEIETENDLHAARKLQHSAERLAELCATLADTIGRLGSIEA